MNFNENMMEENDPDASTTSIREVLSYRQRLEKPAGGEIVLMKWSPTMDLLAATFADKSVRHATLTVLSTTAIHHSTSFAQNETFLLRMRIRRGRWGSRYPHVSCCPR